MQQLYTISFFRFLVISLFVFEQHYSTKVRLVCADVKDNEVVSTSGDDKGCDIEMVVKTTAACGSAASTIIPSLALVVLALLVMF